MKRHLLSTLLLVILGTALSSPLATASNRSVEAALAGYPDLSDFYRALSVTGVLGELNENTRYTIFAPTNTALAEIRPNMYPCFYSEQCRPQLAEVMRNHIVPGAGSLKDLAHVAEVQTIGPYRVLVESPYVGNYTVANRTILTGGEVSGNKIYRINGVIVTDQQLAQFRSLPPVAEGRAYRTPVAYTAPADEDRVSDTVVKKSYGRGGARTITTERTYVTPEGYKAGGEITTITHTSVPYRE